MLDEQKEKDKIPEETLSHIYHTVIHLPKICSVFHHFALNLIHTQERVQDFLLQEQPACVNGKTRSAVIRKGDMSIHTKESVKPNSHFGKA